MRVLLVTNDYLPKPGGIQQYLGGLVAALPAEVLVLAPRDDRVDGPEFGVHRDRRRFLWPTRRVRAWVRDEIEAFAPDVVLYGAPHPLATMGADLRRQTGVPYAVMCYGAEVTVPAAFPLIRNVVRHPLRHADAVFGLSAFTGRRLGRLLGREVRVMGAGVETVFSPGPGAPDTPVVGCVSRFVPRKGQRNVLDAVARLRSEGRDVGCLMVGAGRDEAALRRRAKRLGVPTRFEVGVPYARLPQLYREMTIFAMPCRSRWFGLEAEGLGVVFLEAAATGLPVVAGDSGGAPETVLPGVTGFVVDGDDTLVDAVRMLLDDPAMAAEMGRAGLARVASEWSWEAVAGRFIAGLEEAIDRGAGGHHPDEHS